MTKRLVATHKQIDPELVTAEDLVRAIRAYKVHELAKKLGLETDESGDDIFNWGYGDNVISIANLITPPENKPTPPEPVVKWRGEMPPPMGIDWEGE